MFEAESIMSKQVLTVTMSTPIYDAMNLLVENKVSGLPVVDDDNNLVGLITEKDILRFLLNKDVTTDQYVSDYVNRNVSTFGPKDSIIVICEFFINNPFRRVPIVDNGKIVGIVARRDIISVMLRIRGHLAKH